MTEELPKSTATGIRSWKFEDNNTPQKTIKTAKHRREVARRRQVLVSPNFLYSEGTVLRRTIKGRRALTNYFHALTIDPVRENKKVNSFSLCVSWRHLRQPADMHETNLELGMYQFF